LPSCAHLHQNPQNPPEKPKKNPQRMIFSNRCLSLGKQFCESF
jgi:hypothetical protein